MSTENITIDPRNLRIGNLLLYKGELVHVTTLSLDVDDECEETIGFCKVGQNHNEHVDWNRALYNDLKRIHITPEWLERLDVEMLAGLYKLRHTDFFLRYREDSGVDIAIEDLNGNKHYFRYKIKYLHELQNICYWIMNGEELTIKEPS